MPKTNVRPSKVAQSHESPERLEAYLQGLKRDCGSKRQRASNEQLRDSLKEALIDCGKFARIIPISNPLLLKCRHWPKDLETRRECRGLQSPVNPRWPNWNRVLCEHWIRSWMDIARLLRELGLADLVANQAPPDPIQALTHELFVRLLPPDVGKPEVDLIATEIARHRAKLARVDPDLQDLRYRLGYYFDEWLWPLVEAQLDARNVALAAAAHRGLTSERRLEPVSVQTPDPRQSAALPKRVLLGKRQRRFRDILLELAPDEPTSGPDLCELYKKRFEEYVSDNVFRKDIVPVLKQKLGLKQKNGYGFPRNSRARREVRGREIPRSR
jgi:hypothetical protein